VDVEQGGGLGVVGVGCRGGWGRVGFREATRSHPHQDKHQALSSTPLRPLSLQDGLRLLLHSVGTIHQEAGPQASQWV
jgi:hypothetical protein